MLLSLNLRQIICEANCLEIVEFLKDDHFQFHELAREFVDLQRLLSCDWEVHLHNIHRDAKELVDYLAGMGARLQLMFTQSSKIL